MSAKLVRTSPVPEAERMNAANDRPLVGSWWWVKASKCADYLEWAPILLAAEDWHAKRRTMGDE